MLTKQAIPIPMAMGLNEKVDKWQLPPSQFTRMVNRVFTKDKQLIKRNGFQQLTALPASSLPTTLSTFDDSLVAFGNQLYAYANYNSQWEAQGPFNSVQLSVQTLVRSSTGQTVCDAAVSSTGLVCSTYLDGNGNYAYIINNGTTALIGPITLPSGAALSRVFALGNYFVITFLRTISATVHLQYVAVPLTNIASPLAAVDISTSVTSISAGYDGIVANGSLYLGWSGADVGGAFRLTYLSPQLVQGPTKTLSGHTATLMSMAADTTGSAPVIWITGYSSSSAYSAAFDKNLNNILGATHTITSTSCQAITSTAANGVLLLYSEVVNSYSYSSAPRTDYINTTTCTIGGTVGSPATIIRGMGAASKAFINAGTSYLLAVYGPSVGNTASCTEFQSTYFLIDQNGNIVARLAYSNGAGYVQTQILPSAVVQDNTVSIAYLYQDIVGKVVAPTTSNNASLTYGLFGVNLVTFDFAPASLPVSEIANNLHTSAGYLWMYDGNNIVEHGFHLFPEDINVTTATGSGNLIAQQYIYQITYEWTDNQANIHRSAPSEEYFITTTTSSSTNTLIIPTLRATAKAGVTINVYRWSTAQQTYFQVGTVANVTTSDQVTFTDTLADSAILGNTILYTTGGVIEDICAPSFIDTTLFNTRLFGIDAEDPNLLWFSKQCVEGVPVEMSDLLTYFVPPTEGAQGSTGPCYALAPMDDKLIIFKKDALYYITGYGPDNLGNNSDYPAAPYFIAGTVGTVNPNSIVLIPNGLLFDSDKGKWLLGRDLSLNYLGAPVEDYNGTVVTSATAIPGTNHVRITLEGIQSACLFNGLHTLLDTSGNVLQEYEGYVDSTQASVLLYDYYFNQWGTFELKNGPVLTGLTSAWYNLSGLQGFERFYYFYLLGAYLSPHQLNIQIAYDYEGSPSQSVLINPGLAAPAYASTGFYASGEYGSGTVEQWRIFPRRQKCQAFQISIDEVFDPSQGTLPGAGLTLSGLNLVVGSKKGYKPKTAARSAG